MFDVAKNLNQYGSDGELFIPFSCTTLIEFNDTRLY